MPSLVDVLRERFNAQQDALRALQDEIIASGGNSTDEQDARLADLSGEITAITPRLEQAVTVERSASAAAQLLARAPAAPAPLTPNNNPDPTYRDAGEYLAEYVRAMGNDAPSRTRLMGYLERAAQNQTTVDNPGIVPDPIIGSVLSYIDTKRPIVTALGVRPLPAYPTFHRPSITQHTQVDKQTAEKTEIASRKMIISRLNVTADTYGGYVDLSLQDRDFTNPAIMQILIDDLAGQYALQTEQDTADTLVSLTQQVPLESDADAAAVAAAIYAAAGEVYAGMGTLPNVVFASVDQWGRLGPLFPSMSPTNAYASGFNAGTFGGAVVGLQLVVAPALPAGTIMVGATAAAEVYEQRVGTLQALEVSLLGMQVGYAGYFADVVVQPDGFCKLVDVTP